jgi:hypothetical protein
MIKFSDFLGSKGKEFAADYDGVLAVRPPENGKYPNTPPPAGKRTPYRGSEEEDPGLQMADKDSVDGLADVAVKNMPADKMIPGGKKPQKKVSAVPPPKKLKESQILSEEDRKVIAEGASFVHDLHGEPFTPHPFETMTYISSLLHNPKMVSRLIREVKRQGKLGELVKELLDHPEFYQEVVSNMGHDENGEHVAGKLSRAMHDHAADIKEKYGLSEAPILSKKHTPARVFCTIVDADLRENLILGVIRVQRIVSLGFLHCMQKYHIQTNSDFCEQLSSGQADEQFLLQHYEGWQTIARHCFLFLY